MTEVFSRPKTVGILLFDDVELLDFAGPLQIFTTARYLFETTFNQIDTIAFHPSIKVAKCDLEIKVNRLLTLSDADYDILIIPGGIGTRNIIRDESMLRFISALVQRSHVVCTVCTGSLILAKLGMLSGIRATTHYAAIDTLISIDCSIIVDRSARFIDHERIIISEGVSAGMDMSFYVLSKYYGEQVADEVKKYLEYQY